MACDTQANSRLRKFWKLGRDDVRPEFRNMQAESLSLDSFNILVEVLYLTGMIVFMDEDIGFMAILKK